MLYQQSLYLTKEIAKTDNEYQSISIMNKKIENNIAHLKRLESLFNVGENHSAERLFEKLQLKQYRRKLKRQNQPKKLSAKK